ncbi:MAG: M23 family metallopeptidase [Lachnospiraceae bacterium]|nr:M23 family metallopeptidase [Lachnospiraceae bacterium]
MKIKISEAAFLFCLVMTAAFLTVLSKERVQKPVDDGYMPGEAVLAATDSAFITWVDFNVSFEALNAAYELDVASYDQPVRLNWIELLAYSGAKNGGKFGKNAVSTIKKAAADLSEGKMTIAQLTADLDHYPYYYEAYEAVLGGMVGEFEIEREIEIENATEDGQITKEWKKLYGLKAFLPIAHGFPYSDYDDFGSSRNYGYARVHLGHDMMGQIGTPIMAVESGIVENLGWNQYGGWRIGIRSFDGKRYYYYAHLRQNYPYADGLSEGDVVTAGDVIGYMGHTGYSTTENVNNIKSVHLHWGLQLIFDESQRDSDNEIWVDCYALTRFLYRNRSKAEKVGETREWQRVFEMKDPAVAKFTNIF